MLSSSSEYLPGCCFNTPIDKMASNSYPSGTENISRQNSSVVLPPPAIPFYCKIEDIVEFRYDPSQNVEFGITSDLQQLPENSLGPEEEMEEDS